MFNKTILSGSRIKKITYLKLGVIACFNCSSDEDRETMTNFASELYSVCDDCRPVVASTQDELVDPDMDVSNLMPVERKSLEEIKIPLAVLERAKSKHDVITIVYIIATDLDDKPMHFYMSVRSERFIPLCKQGQMNRSFDLADFGRVIWKGENAPTREDRDTMFDNWLFVDRFLPVKLIARKAGGE